MNLAQVSQELARRLASLFLPNGSGRRPCHGEDERFASDPAWRDLVLFHEFFHGDTGRGLGASHQTGWTALAVRCLEDIAAQRRDAKLGVNAAPRPSRRASARTGEGRPAANPAG